MFRFSLKWILAAMVYAAIAAAAFSQETWVYADLLCGAALLALGYAILLIVYTRGPRQAAAVGFATCVILLATALVVAPQSVPTLRVITAAGLAEQPILPATPPSFATGNLQSSGAWWNVGPGVPTSQFQSSPNATLSIVAASPVPVVATPTFDITLKLRAANAVALMLVGLLGCLLGLMAYRRAHGGESSALASSR
jgi:hypothetical protein